MNEIHKFSFDNTLKPIYAHIYGNEDIMEQYISLEGNGKWYQALI